MTMPAPIALFTYNRPMHTKRVLASLARNPEFDKSPVYIYCDAPKNEEHAQDVAETREIVQMHAPKHARIVIRDRNFGLAKSIITGVSELTDEYGTVIVIEDDLVLTSGALSFMNTALARYQDYDRVMHVAAYMFPVNARFTKPFFYREATCWGWATWARAWQHFNPDAGALLNEIDQRSKRSEFDVRGSMFFYQMLRLQRDNKLDSWAIRWYASMFLRDGLSLHPPKSYVENLGFDGTGVHCNVDSRFEVATTNRLPTEWPENVQESEDAIQAMIDYRSKSSSLRSQLRRQAQRVLGSLNPWA